MYISSHAWHEGWDWWCSIQCWFSISFSIHHPPFPNSKSLLLCSVTIIIITVWNFILSYAGHKWYELDISRTTEMRQVFFIQSQLSGSLLYCIKINMMNYSNCKHLVCIQTACIPLDYWLCMHIFTICTKNWKFAASGENLRRFSSYIRTLHHFVIVN